MLLLIFVITQAYNGHFLCVTLKFEPIKQHWRSVSIGRANTRRGCNSSAGPIFIYSIDSANADIM